MLKVMCQLMRVGTYAHAPAYVQLRTEWIVIIQFSDFRFALFVFALSSCYTFAWLLTPIYAFLLCFCLS